VLSFVILTAFIFIFILSFCQHNIIPTLEISLQQLILLPFLCAIGKGRPAGNITNAEDSLSKPKVSILSPCSSNSDKCEIEIK
jgi:hypothetical protein